MSGDAGSVPRGLPEGRSEPLSEKELNAGTLTNLRTLVTACGLVAVVLAAAYAMREDSKGWVEDLQKELIRSRGEQQLTNQKLDTLAKAVDNLADATAVDRDRSGRHLVEFGELKAEVRALQVDVARNNKEIERIRGARDG